MKTTKVTPTQAKVLAEAVKTAYDNGWDGKLAKSSLRPRLNDRAVTEPTRLAMEAKGLVEWSNTTTTHSGRFLLTTEGVAAGNEFYEKRHATTAAHDAKVVRDKARKEAQEEQDKLSRAAHLFRGLDTSRRSEKGSGTKAMSSRIKHMRWSEVRLNVDDLIALGESIEKLR